jgi:hypothetical protein
MNNISWRVVPKGKVWYWEREDTFTVLRTGPFSSYTACADDANWNGFALDKISKVAKRHPGPQYEPKRAARQRPN